MRHGRTPVRLVIAVALCLRQFGVAILAAPVLAGAITIGVVSGPTLGPALGTVIRWLPNLSRRLAGVGGGTPIERPYPPPPTRPGMAGYRARVHWVLSDPASWRDLAWLATEPVVGGILLLPGVAVLFGWVGLLLPGVEGWSDWLYGGDTAPARTVAAVAGAALIVAGSALAPHGLRWHSRWCALLLAPTRAAGLRLERDRLAQRVRQLTDTRADATNAQATELRRIERDLHDGAQARLAAVTITLGAAEALLDTDPGAARQLYAQARRSTQTALDELRDLVNGIHPPVLAERGLVAALQALALDSGSRLAVTGQLPGRPPEPVETAAYFAASELIANLAKHAGGSAGRVDVQHHAGRLRITVEDDGPGGADPAAGTGLSGIGRRLGAFDGSLRLSSPPGGPTTAVLEVPCELSSPKTTNS
ncbi:sensor histidine kinase [Rugosimonospora africana]|uniref:histidine kinase n=1 Tax=Rugosimonospora africana TaxID=556532 RepID=A0A8J3QXY5_9ACTN|nr:histidine kinase [Rugosimonospora africana]GIH18329.1 hypothetical protein Raf01_65010 [Rugosimonospora africana]